MIDSQLQSATDKTWVSLTQLSFFLIFPHLNQHFSPSIHCLHATLEPRTTLNTFHDLINLCTAPPAQAFAVYHSVKTFGNIVMVFISSCGNEVESNVTKILSYTRDIAGMFCAQTWAHTVLMSPVWVALEL